jgi:antitoxin YefM
MEADMPHVDQFISVTEAKNKLLDLIRRLKTKQEVVAITRDGMPAAVLLSMDQFEGLMETLEILSDPKTMRSLRRSMKQAQAGKWLPHEAVFEREGL